MHGADGVAYGRFAYSAVFLCILYGGFKIAHVVKSIKYPYDVNAVLYRLAAELLHDVVGIMLIAQYILAAEKHLQFGIGQRLFKLPQPVPRILVEEAEACVKRGSAPALQGPIANAVQHFACGKHIFRAHTGGSLGLMRVPQYSVGNKYFLAHPDSSSIRCFVLYQCTQ